MWTITSIQHLDQPMYDLEGRILMFFGKKQLLIGFHFAHIFAN